MTQDVDFLTQEAGMRGLPPSAAGNPAREFTTGGLRFQAEGSRTGINPCLYKSEGDSRFKL